MTKTTGRPGKAIVFDHLDSYSLNVADAVATAGFEPVIVRPVAPRPEHLFLSDDLLKDLRECSAVVLSPGPGHPKDYDLRALEVFLRDERPELPVLGICLGMQTLLHWHGMEIVPLGSVDKPVVHGRVKPLTRRGWKLPVPFHHLQSSWGMVFYNSLGVGWKSCGAESHDWLLAPSVDDEPYVTVAVHRRRPWLGVQFHPESFASKEGSTVFRAFAEWCAQARGDLVQEGDHPWSADSTQRPLSSSSCLDSCTSAIT